MRTRSDTMAKMQPNTMRGRAGLGMGATVAMCTRPGTGVFTTEVGVFTKTNGEDAGDDDDRDMDGNGMWARTALGHRTRGGGISQE
eukprot:gene11485-biopygen5935